jgi:hypothetical protein
MTVQSDEILIIDGEETSMSCCPSWPENHPSIIRRGQEDPFYMGLSTGCRRGYIGTWEIKNNNFYLKSIKGAYKVENIAPILATWFSGIISVPLGEIVENNYYAEIALYEKEMYIQIKNGHVIAKNTFDNAPEYSNKAYELMDSAYQLASEDKRKAIELFKESESHASAFYDLVLLGYYIIDALHDHTWTRNIYLRAYQKYREASELLKLEFFIRNHLGDTDWANEVLIKSINAYDFDPLDSVGELEMRIRHITRTDDVQKIADSLIEKSGSSTFDLYINIKAFSDVVHKAIEKQSPDASFLTYKKIEKLAVHPTILMLFAKEAHKNLNNSELTASFYKKAEGLIDGFGRHIDLAEAVVERVGDKAWAKALYKKAAELVTDCHGLSVGLNMDRMTLAAAVIDHLEDKHWGRKIYQEIYESDAYVCQWDLVKAISTKLGDKKWAREIFQIQVDEYKSKWPTDLYKHGVDIAIDLGDKEWAREIFSFSEKVLMKSQENDSRSRRDLIQMAIDIIKALGDFVWAKRIYSNLNKADIRTNELEELADVVVSYAHDQDWASEILLQAKVNKRELDKKNEAERKEREARRNRWRGITALPVNHQDSEEENRYYRAKEKNARNTLDLIHLGEELMEINDEKWAFSVFRKAAEIASNPKECSALKYTIVGYTAREKYMHEEWMQVIALKIARVAYRKNPDIKRWIKIHQN